MKNVRSVSQSELFQRYLGGIVCGKHFIFVTAFSFVSELTIVFNPMTAICTCPDNLYGNPAWNMCNSQCCASHWSHRHMLRVLIGSKLHSLFANFVLSVPTFRKHSNV